MTGIGQPNMRLRSALFSALAYLADCVQGAENAARARASPSPRDECFPAHASLSASQPWSGRRAQGRCAPVSGDAVRFLRIPDRLRIRKSPTSPTSWRPDSEREDRRSPKKTWRTWGNRHNEMNSEP